MTWDEVELALRTHIETQWALGAYASVELVWENEQEPDLPNYMAVYIEGVYAEKTIYGSVGKRSAVDAGIVFFHSFIPSNQGKSETVKAVVLMSQILELKVISSYIDLEGANPPSPAIYGTDDRLLPNPQPGGNYYRCSGSVPFIVRSVV